MGLSLCGQRKESGNCERIFRLGIRCIPEVTRQDMAAILYRVMQDKKVSLDEAKQDLHFTDESQIADYAVEAVRELTEMGILNGFEDGSFQPEEYVTRAMAAKVVYCLLELCQ